MKKLAAACLLLLLFRPAPATADHAPEWLLAKRSTVPRILGMSVDDVTLADVIRRFGKPTSRQSDPKFPQEALYTWRSGELTVRASTVFPPTSRSPKTEQVTTIEVAGPAASRATLTEHGLRLGDDLRMLVNTYGWRYQTGWRRPQERESAAVTFIFQDESELTAGFDDDGKLVRLYIGGGVE
ncbi:MAG TPA: hypothetical protein VGF28_16825 [Thermoanaerobaculia bacterium]|jgi:hypothetical protein